MSRITTETIYVLTQNELERLIHTHIGRKEDYRLIYNKYIDMNREDVLLFEIRIKFMRSVYIEEIERFQQRKDFLDMESNGYSIPIHYFLHWLVVLGHLQEGNYKILLGDRNDD